MDCFAEPVIGPAKPDPLARNDKAVPTPGEGRVLLRTIWLSLDPYMRGRVSDGPSYATPVPIGGVMEGANRSIAADLTKARS